MGSLVPEQALIYERANGMIYARYRDAPYDKIPRWVVGGSESDDYFFPSPDNSSPYARWRDVYEVAKKNPALQRQLDNLLTTYYTVRDEYKEDKNDR